MRDLPDISDVAAPPTLYMPAARLVVQTVLRRFEVHVAGTHHVPRAGPVILASNHMGYLDGPLLFASAPRRVHALVKESMFEGVLGYLLAKSGQIRVDRLHCDPCAVKTCLKVLDRSGAVAIYPEGARGRGEVAATKGGAAYLALVTGAPVVPVACLGTRTHGAGTSSMPPRGSRLDLVFGAPLRFDKVAWPRTAKQVAAVAAEVQEVMAELVASACDNTGQSLPALPEELV